MSAGSTKACMRTVGMASKKLKWSKLPPPTAAAAAELCSEGRREPLCEEDSAALGWVLVLEDGPGLERVFEEAVEGMAVEEKERRPESGGGKAGEEEVLLRLR